LFVLNQYIKTQKYFYLCEHLFDERPNYYGKI